MIGSANYVTVLGVSIDLSEKAYKPLAFDSQFSVPVCFYKPLYVIYTRQQNKWSS